MDTFTKILLGYLCVANVAALVLYGMDKAKAKRKKWRIPEATLLMAAFVGGSAGALMGMYLFRHKTKHPAFYIGVPIMLILHGILVFWCLSQ